MFSANSQIGMRTHVASIFEVQLTNDLGRYLGLPSFLGRNKVATFRYIEHNIRNRITMWQQKFLTKAGKEVLLKSIAQAMPIFTMFVFLLPSSTCDAIEKCMNRF